MEAALSTPVDALPRPGASRRPSASPRFSAYVASKAALDAWTRCAASEYADLGVKFTTIKMPLVRTPMIAPTKLYNSVPTLSPEEAADGVVAVCRQLRQRLPKTKILLLAVFPRDPVPGTELRKKVAQLNTLLAQLDQDKMIQFLDISQAFLEPDGSLSQSVMPDYLHPNAEGYRRWVQAMAPTLTQMMEE